MSYPLTGSAQTGTTAVVTPAPPLAKFVMTRVDATIPLPGYARSGVTTVVTPVPPIMTTHPQRQWGIAPTFEVISDHWGVF